MINEILFPLLAFVLVFSGGLFLVFGFQDYKKRNKKKYDFLTSFPFELVQGNGRGSFFSRLCFVLYAIIYVASSFYELYLSPSLSFLNQLGVLLGVVSIMIFVSMLIIVYVPAYSFRVHLFFSVVFFALSVLSDVLIGLIYLNLYQAQLTIMPLIIMSFAFISALFKGLILINPKLAHWTELDTSVGSDNVVTSSRPRPFVLAFSQWLIIFLNALSLIVYMLGLFLTCLS